MYMVHFLSGERPLGERVREVITHSSSAVYSLVSEEIDLTDCEIFAVSNTARVRDGDLFFGLSYDQSSVYLFVNDDAVHSAISSEDGRRVAESSVAKHLCRSLYGVARAKHIGLDADCGLLEEVVNEGLSEKFVVERLSVDPHERYTRLPDTEVKRLWERMCDDRDNYSPGAVEKWFRGDAGEGVPPFAACSVGFAIATAYLDATKQTSVDALTTVARDVIALQTCY